MLRAQVGLADLLRALHLHRDRGEVDVLPLEGGTHSGLRYRKQPEQPPKPQPVRVELEGTGHASQALDTSAPRLSARSPLRMPEVWVAERLTSDTENSGAQDAPADAERLPLLPAEELFREQPRQVGYEDLVPHPRLAQPLTTRLRRSRPGAVDLPALVRAAAHQRWPRTLPRSRRLAWPHTLVVVLDQSDALYPYWEDMRRLAGWLRARVPKAQLRIRMLRHGPLGTWRPSAWWPERMHEHVHPHPQPGHTYLLLSDLGLLHSDDSHGRAWETWLAGAAACRAPCVALAPVAAELVPRSLAVQVRLLRWSPDSRALPEHGRPAQMVAQARQQTPAALQQLLGCLAATLSMDPPLLRSLRQHSGAPNDASLEGRLWAHPHVRAHHFATLRENAPRRSPSLESTPAPALWPALHAQVARHHQHWPFVWRLVEQLQQIACSSPAPVQALLDDTRLALRSFAAIAHDAQAGRDVLTASADYILRRTPDAARDHLRAELDAVADAVGHPTGSRRPWCLLQRGEHVYIALAGDARPAGPGVVLCGDIGQAAAGELVRIAQPQQLPGYWPLPVEGRLRLPPLSPGSVVTLGGVETELTRLQRARGVWGWSQRDERVSEILDLPLSTDEFDFPVERGRHLSVAVRGQGSRDLDLRVDRDVYGAFLELHSPALLANGYPSNLPLRFRYLEPATFLQGFPEGIGDDDEHPRHPVTLTQGLWLAETPCTQALWRAVMGWNPSHFTDGKDAPRRPVENVSWDDVAAFLKKLHRLLPPRWEAVLPTESQWEYACRAGTQTKYWWGDEADGNKANFDTEGNRALEDKNGTTPVDRYPPNPWGLYDMHGNVWEWCADGLRDYTAEPARDPEGPGAGDVRVVRGGSWVDYPGTACAAFRLWGHRWDAPRYQGFRFALRSPVGPEGQARTDGADAPAAEPARRARGKRPSSRRKDQDKDTPE